MLGPCTWADDPVTPTGKAAPRPRTELPRTGNTGRRGEETQAITPALRAMIDQQLLNAIELHQWPAVTETVADIARKSNESQAAAIDGYLESLAQPPLARIIVGAYLRMAEQNIDLKGTAPKGKELALVLEGIQSVTQEVLAERQTHHMFQTPTADQLQEFGEFERRLWDAHVLENRIESAWRTAKLGERFAQARRATPVKNLTASQKEALEADYGALADKLEAMRRDLLEHGLALRIRRIHRAEQLLAESKSVSARLEASFTLDWDGDLLAELFARRAQAEAKADPPDAAQNKKVKPNERKAGGDAKVVNKASAESPENPALPAAEEPPQPTPNTSPLDLESVTAADLHRPELGEQIRLAVAHGRQVAGRDLIEKSRLLFTGMHWWFRGRYGAGSEAFGLLKNPTALRSPQVMFALYMPRVPPRPTAPSPTGTNQPQIDRRHHYLWRYTTERFVFEASKTQASYKELTKTAGAVEITTSHFY